MVWDAVPGALQVVGELEKEEGIDSISLGRQVSEKRTVAQVQGAPSLSPGNGAVPCCSWLHSHTGKARNMAVSYRNIT